MLDKCCICGGEVITKTQIAFEDLLGSGEKRYNQYVGLCRNCGFVFTQNPYTEEQLANRYKNMSKFEYDAEDYFLDTDYVKKCTRQKHFIEENIDMGEVSSLLEIGAASGYNLSLYKNKLDVFGIEPSNRNCHLARKNYGIQMFCGMYDEYISRSNNCARQPFDIIFLSMILEHIVNPKKFIDDIKNLCNRYLFIEVPSLDIRCYEEPYGIFCEEHVNIFTLDSLNYLMNACGFKLVNAEIFYGVETYLPAGYPAIVSLWEKNEVSSNHFKYNIYSSEELLEVYLRESKKGLDKVKEIINSIPSETRLAVWGIGHHASMLMANTSLRKKNIVRVYDSDSRKAGIEFAGCEITQFTEYDISSGAVEAILLTTYTAQKAIKRYLDNMNLDCRVYTLYDI